MSEPPRISIADFLRTDRCDWVGVRFKDRRRGKMWLCRACGARGLGRKEPGCPAKAILAKIGPK